MGAVYMSDALFALDLILLYHFVSTFIVPLPIFARPFVVLSSWIPLPFSACPLY